MDQKGETDMTPAFGLTTKLIDSLYLEAMVLADEARSYFDQFSRNARADMTPLQRVSLSCESLKVTTRLMHSTAWLLAQRSPQGTSNPLAAAAPSEATTVDTLPEEAQAMIRESEDLYARIQRLNEKLANLPECLNPARDLRAMLERAF